MITWCSFLGREIAHSCVVFAIVVGTCIDIVKLFRPREVEVSLFSRLLVKLFTICGRIILLGSNKFDVGRPTTNLQGPLRYVHALILHSWSSLELRRVRDVGPNYCS